MSDTCILAYSLSIFTFYLICLEVSGKIKVLARRPAKENSVPLGLFPEDDGRHLPWSFYLFLPRMGRGFSVFGNQVLLLSHGYHLHAQDT